MNVVNVPVKTLPYCLQIFDNVAKSAWNWKTRAGKEKAFPQTDGQAGTNIKTGKSVPTDRQRDFKN